MSQEIESFSQPPNDTEENFGYHIVDNTKRPLFTEEDLLRGNLEGNYVLITGQNPPFVAVKVGKTTELESMVARISLARLRERIGLEMELSPEEEAILNDPNSMGGTNIDYITHKSKILLNTTSGQIEEGDSRENKNLVSRIIRKLKSSD